jgi:prophage antirepressor-like protein
MNALTPFDFEGRAVRVVEDQAGVPWFVALDVCECLGISKYRDAVARLDDDEGCPVVVDTLGGQQQVSAVNEPGLYSLILTSRKPEAKRFKRWVTHDVLPALRKTGSYSLPEPEPDEVEETPPPVPVSATHRADVLVSATRTFAALAKAGRTLRMSHIRALAAANAATYRTTGIDLAEELDATDLLAEGLPALPRDDGLSRELAAWLEGKDKLTTDEIIVGAGLGEAGNRALQMRVATTMRALGWYGEKRRWNGGRLARRWMRYEPLRPKVVDA